MELKIGDVVQPKSGGPRMTVEEIDGTYIGCVWFEKDKPHRHSFDAALLVLSG
ncbi:YodC family protein [Novosphingobium sp.]|uniref:YodC family protein n=1 Tax=Novosphingobium sp. TaxID=1874826 RepID=UPI00352637A2